MVSPPLRHLPITGFGLALALACAALFAAGARADSPGAPEPMRLAGLVTLDLELVSRWCASGTWITPVGDSCFPDNGEAPYAVNRGLERDAGGAFTHRGADLCNRHAGGTVRAAAHGLVVLAATSSRTGYGAHVVLAHRLPDSSVAYTIYAHLAPASVSVVTGQIVAAGEALGRVGRSGNASTDHLHFEVRLPERLDARWEKCATVDPIAFVEARRSCRSEDTTWARPYLEWAERGALIAPHASGDAPLTRHAWWRMLACVAPPASTAGDAPHDLRAMLIETGVLPPDEPTSDDPLEWRETVSGLERLRDRGVRTPAFVTDARHAPVCENRLASAEPSRHPDAIANVPGRPSVADACLVLADLSASPSDPAMGAHEP